MSQGIAKIHKYLKYNLSEGVCIPNLHIQPWRNLGHTLIPGEHALLPGDHNLLLRCQIVKRKDEPPVEISFSSERSVMDISSLAIFWTLQPSEDWILKYNRRKVCTHPFT